jgi:phage repressor protein C with HTH and peptisase S24 domain
MKRDNESPADRLIKARLKAGFESASAAARALGMAQQTYLAHENGNRSFDIEMATKYAKKFKVNLVWLLTGEGAMREGTVNNNIRDNHSTNSVRNVTEHGLRLIRVVGEIQAGEPVEALEWPIGQQYEIPLPIAEAFHKFPVQALVVRGPSMDEVYPDGSMIVCIKFMDLGRNPRSGERVVALRSQPSGLYEASVKEFRIDRDGMARLWPRSSHPDFQQPITVEDQLAAGETLSITHLVIGSYRPEA